MYSIVLGVAYVLSDSSTVIIDGSGFGWLGSSDVWRIPVPVFFFLAVWAIGQYLLRTTALGRHIYAVGDNAESAVRAGVRADGLRIGLFIAMSLLRRSPASSSHRSSPRRRRRSATRTCSRS